MLVLVVSLVLGLEVDYLTEHERMSLHLGRSLMLSGKKDTNPHTVLLM